MCYEGDVTQKTVDDYRKRTKEPERRSATRREDARGSAFYGQGVPNETATHAGGYSDGDFRHRLRRQVDTAPA
jgi:hypothetical protein